MGCEKSREPQILTVVDLCGCKRAQVSEPRASNPLASEPAAGEGIAPLYANYLGGGA